MPVLLFGQSFDALLFTCRYARTWAFAATRADLFSGHFAQNLFSCWLPIRTYLLNRTRICQT